MARTRTFIALPVSAATRNLAAVLMDRLTRAAPEVRWVKPENIHLTLKFLGDVEDRDLPAVCQAAARAAAAVGPFALRVAGVGAFPSTHRPRTIWIGLDGDLGPLGKLHQDLETELRPLGFRPEARKFSPHITLGRVRVVHRTEGLAEKLAEKADWVGGTLAAEEILVMASDLRPEGPIYSVLSRAALGRPEG